MGPFGDIGGTFVGIIKHRHTEEYYRGGGRWTPDLKEAMEFESLRTVVEEANKYHIIDCCEFILRFTDRSDFDVAIPL
jgi:hypothetical protein